jgi:AbrB family looped-hinge helix DNA binding protein
MLNSSINAASKIHSGGRVIIPSHIREFLHFKVGDTVILRVDDGELRVISQAEAIRRAQMLVAQYIPSSVSLVDELIEERRREAAKEAAEYSAFSSGTPTP